MEKIIVNKNRGWRGLAEVQLLNNDNVVMQKMIFSFSQPVWNDMILRGKLIMQDKDNYIILNFDADKSSLPRPWQQRSVLIKNAILPIVDKKVYPKTKWQSETKTAEDYGAICNFLANRNNHTTSDWNCIGIRVIPTI